MLSTRIQLLVIAAALLLVPVNVEAGVVVTDGRIANGRNCPNDSSKNEPAGSETEGRSGLTETVNSNLGTATGSEDGSEADDLEVDLDDLTAEERELYLLAASVFNGHYRDNNDGRGPVPTDDPAYIIGDISGDSAGGCAATPGVGLAALAALGLLLGRRRRR